MSAKWWQYWRVILQCSKHDGLIQEEIIMNRDMSRVSYAGNSYSRKEGCRIEKGDRIFASLRVNGRTLTEHVFTTIEGMTELLGELRYAMRGYRGLVRMVVRNMSRGWCIDRPLMLYPDVLPANCAATAKSACFNSEPAKPTRMPFPWETH